MAKIVEEHLVIKLSQLVRDDQSAGTKLSDEFIGQVEAIVAELAGDGCVVEVITE